MSDHAACQASAQAIYDAAVEAMEDTSGLWKPRDLFEYRLGTTGHLYHREGIADIIRERDTFARALSLAVGSPDLREAYVQRAKDALAREGSRS